MTMMIFINMMLLTDRLSQVYLLELHNAYAASFIGPTLTSVTKPHLFVTALHLCLALLLLLYKLTMIQLQSLAGEMLPARPTTAPPTEARLRYHAVNRANDDLYRYRHSGGICPKEYKVCM